MELERHWVDPEPFMTTDRNMLGTKNRGRRTECRQRSAFNRFWWFVCRQRHYRTPGDPEGIAAALATAYWRTSC